MQKTGTVQQIVGKTTDKGKTYFRVNVDGVWYSSWAALTGINQGDNIEFEEIIKGDFKNLANPKKMDGVGQPGVETGNQTPVRTSRPNGSFDPDRESRIMRQNAFSTAAIIVGASKVGQGKADVREVLDTTLEVAKQVFLYNMYGFDNSVKPTEGTEIAKGAVVGRDFFDQ